MKKQHAMAEAMLWATAIIAAAALATPVLLSLIPLPSLVAAALLNRTATCSTWSDTP